MSLILSAYSLGKHCNQPPTPTPTPALILMSYSSQDLQTGCDFSSVVLPGLKQSTREGLNNSQYVPRTNQPTAHKKKTTQFCLSMALKFHGESMREAVFPAPRRDGNEYKLEQ